MAETGITAAASLPVARCRARERGDLHAGQLVVIVGFGAGLAWSCQVFRINESSECGA